MRTYDKVRIYMQSRPDEYVKIREVAEHTGLSYRSVQKVLQMAWYVGYVKRKGKVLHENALGENKVCMSTSYKIKEMYSWRRLYSYEYKTVLDNKV